MALKYCAKASCLNTVLKSEVLCSIHSDKMRFQVTVVGEPMQDFTSAESAIDYAARHVYLPWDKGQAATLSLKSGKSFSYAFGFKEVEIKVTK